MLFLNKKKRVIHLSTGAKGDLALLEEGDIVVSGLFEGDIRIRGTLTVEKGATIRGRVSAETVIIKGKVCGDIYALKGVELYAGAELRGDVKAASLAVQKEAHFWGRCEIMVQSVKEKKKEAQMTPEETSLFLQIDVDTLLELAESKKIPAWQDDHGTWCFDRIDLERWISENSLTANSTAVVSKTSKN